MHVYTLLIAQGPGGLPRTVDFEAEDDAAALDLAAHYYADSAGELWRGERLVERFGAAAQEP